MRSVVLFCAGALLGVLLGVTLAYLTRAERRHGQAVMVVLDSHLAALRAGTERGSCPPPDATRRLHRLAQGHAEFELAFPDAMRDDEGFRRLAAQFGAAIESMRQPPPSDCAAWRTSLTGLTGYCRECHRHYRGVGATAGP